MLRKTRTQHAIRCRRWKDIMAMRIGCHTCHLKIWMQSLGAGLQSQISVIGWMCCFQGKTAAERYKNQHCFGTMYISKRKDQDSTVSTFDTELLTGNFEAIPSIS